MTVSLSLSRESIRAMSKSTRDEFFMNVYRRALKAGIDAGKAALPTPMNVGHAMSLTSNEIDYSRPTYYVSEGACGFAWVTIYPGNHPFANWLKKHGWARPKYGGGVDIWISDHNQSVERKEAHARAMVEVFRSYGLEKVYAGSRLD